MKITIEFPDPPVLLRPVYDELAQSLGQLSQRDAAALLHLSPTAFSHCFRRHAGNSFRRARAIIKLQVAAALLEQTNYPITEVARHLKYTDRYSLERAFKQHFGRTPTEHRRACAKVTSQDI